MTLQYGNLRLAGSLYQILEKNTAFRGIACELQQQMDFVCNCVTIAESAHYCFAGILSYLLVSTQVVTAYSQLCPTFLRGAFSD